MPKYLFEYRLKTRNKCLMKVFKFSQNPVITGFTAGHTGMLLLCGGFLESEHYLLNQGSEKQILLTVGALSSLSVPQWGCWRTKGKQFAQKCKAFLKPFVKIKMGRAQFVCSVYADPCQMLDVLLMMYKTLYVALLGLMCLLKPCVWIIWAQFWAQINNRAENQRKHILSGRLMVIL